MPNDDDAILSPQEKAQAKTAIRIIIEGKVQKVGFRQWMKNRAVGFSITGWVRNKADGSVEAFLYGEEGLVKELINMCHHGPSFSLVRKIREFPQKDVGNAPIEFTILPST